MADVTAKFSLNNDNNLNPKFNLSEQDNIDATFVINASSTTWGSISGTLSNQIDLQEALDLKADKTELDADIAEVNTTISDLETVVNNNYTTLDNKIDSVESNLSGDISALSTTVQNNYDTLDARITTNTNNIAINTGNITTNANNISDIQDLIPNQATTSNQLADKDFVNSSIATNTAYFIGTFNSVAQLEAYSGTLTNNDYAFVVTTDSAGNTLYDRYKYNGSKWLFEYELNNSSFTANQWSAINSGATATNIGQIATNTNDIADLQTNKQDNLTAGANIQINNNVISATDTTYTAGTGISIVNNVISNTQTSAEWGNITGTLSNQTDLQDALDGKTLVTFRDWSVA